MAITETLGSNEDCVMAMLGLLGGIDGMVEKGVRLTDLVQILRADPDDDLSGLRLIAGRMVDGPDFDYRPLPAQERLVEPLAARRWLIKSTRMREAADGSLVFRDEQPDHLGKAALSIALGTEPVLLTESYTEATDNRSPLHVDQIRRISENMIEQFEALGRITVRPNSKYL